MRTPTLSDNHICCNVPVLFLTFNRPDETKIVFQAIRTVKPKILYIACDGPRKDNELDPIRVAQVKSIVQNVDWECHCEYLFRDTNLGCGKGVAGAIDWFFTNNEHGIVLEDDCVPTPSFFIFCQEMLFRYKDSEEIMAIAGTNITKGIKYESDYVYSNFPIMWGWATWRRAWNKYDYLMNKWPIVKINNSLSKDLNDRWKLHPVYIEFYEKTYESIHNNKINTWDHQWIFCNWFNHGLTITTTKNLVRNIGFGAEATHTTSDELGRGNFITFLSLPPYKGPAHISPHDETDRYIGKHWFTATWIYYIKILLLRVKLIRSLWTWIKKKFNSI